MIELLPAVVVLALLPVVLWTVLAWPAVGRALAANGETVAVLIPARNEETAIGPTLERCMAQGAVVSEIVVLDDGSTDGTAAVVRGSAAGDPRVRLVNGAALPDGWCGKPHACAQLADASSAPWLLFIDADSHLSSDAASRLVAEARRRNCTMLSVWPKLVMRSFAERILMPMLDFVVFSIYPAALSLRRDDASLALAHGACILARRDVYERIGGHAAVRSELFEDQMLSRHWRRSGERSLALHGAGILDVRMYDSLAALWAGFTKNFRPAFRHEPSFWAFMVLHVIVFTAPFFWFVAQPSLAVGVAVAGVVAMRLMLALRFGHPMWSAFLHPVAALFLGALGATSWWRWRVGSGVEWKGRRYRSPSNSGAE